MIVSVLATAAIGYVVYKTLVPVPAGPYNTFPYIFLAWICGCCSPAALAYPDLHKADRRNSAPILDQNSRYSR